jgi:hypothetical protein
MTEKDLLDPVLHLIGDWHGEGMSPFGPYRFRTSITRRGRWLLHKSDISDVKSGKPLFTSTWMWGHELDGQLSCFVFDTSGVFKFSGKKEGKILHFRWEGGSAWRQFVIEPLENGSIKSKYEAHTPGEGPVVDFKFESVWLPGEG